MCVGVVAVPYNLRVENLGNTNSGSNRKASRRITGGDVMWKVASEELLNTHIKIMQSRGKLKYYVHIQICIRINFCYIS